jgi:thermitase
MKAHHFFSARNAFRFIFLAALLLLPVHPASGQSLYGIDPGIDIMEWDQGEVVRDEALVQFRSYATPAERTALHEKLGCRVIETVAPGLERIDLNGKPLGMALEGYNKEPLVEYAEPHVIYRTFFTPNDSSWNLQWGPKNIKCPEAWDIHKGSSNTYVAILDSSVDYNHADLKAHYHYGYDYFYGDSDPYDFFDIIGHGTHCSGIAAAVTNNANGIAGVGFDCKFAFYQVGALIIISDAAVIQAINDTISKGWHVISMSFGGAQPSQSMENALNNAYNAGVVCISSAGNDGNTAMLYPAGYANVLSVASHNQANQKSSFSTYGSWVDVSAPGEQIYSTIYEFWGGYTYMDGTSMAGPHVAGMANILYSLLGSVRSKTNADLILDAIRNSCVNVSWVKHGRVDLEAAMLLLTGPNPPTITDVSPSNVQAFMGGTITVSGNDFTDVTEISSGGIVLYPPDFTIVNDQTITYEAPTASALGQTEVTVTSPEGTSNPGYFNYVETDPPKLSVPATTGAGQSYTWSWGGGVNDFFYLIVSTEDSTLPFQGFDVLSNFLIIYTGNLDNVGLGSLTITVPAGLAGITVYSQVLTFEPSFVGASNIASTTILD